MIGIVFKNKVKRLLSPGLLLFPMEYVKQNKGSCSPAFATVQISLKLQFIANVGSSLTSFCFGSVNPAFHE